LSVASRLSSILSTIRLAGVKLWAVNPELQSKAVEPSNAPANLPKGNALIERIVVFLDPSFGGAPPDQTKSCGAN
jgi:hypothetical protein